MSNSNSSSSGGIGFFGLLGIAFIVLKLCGVIDWSWWWVLLPLYGGLAIVLVVLLIVGIVYYFKARDEKKRIAAGMNSWAWKNRKKKSHKPDQIHMPLQSKWQQRMEEMQKNKR